MIGKTVSHYNIIEKLGEGGMGVVYLAEDTRLHRRVALKFLPKHFTSDADARERFEREARAAAALNHPNIVTVYDIGEAEGQVFMAIELVDGETLADRIAGAASGRPMAIEEISDIIGQIAEGLGKAHDAGIVHRDVKPSNIMINSDGRVKILDFGLAKLKGASDLTKEASTLGTVQYMSPEQARGEKVDRRSDIWSIGAVLYEMLTARKPFAGEYDQHVIYSILHDEPDPPGSVRKDLPPGLERIIQKALRKDRDERYRDTGGIIRDLKSGDRKDAAGRGSRGFGIMKWAFAALVVIAAAVVILKIRSGDSPRRLSRPVSRQVTFTGSAIEPSISPDGNSLAYFTGYATPDGSINIKDIESGSQVKILSIPMGFNIHWSPDGSRLLYCGFQSEKRSGIYLLPRLGGTPRKLLGIPWYFISWAPDGNRFAFSRVGTSELRILDISSGDTTSVLLEQEVGEIEDLDWSPLGDEILFQANDREMIALWIVKSDGKDQTKLFELEQRGGTFAGNPRWSWDGRAIYYLESRIRGRIISDLMKIGYDRESRRLDGESYVVLSNLHISENFGIGKGFSISSDGKRFVYKQQSDRMDLWLMKAEGEGEGIRWTTRQLTNSTMLKTRPSISPDGRSVAFGMGNDRSFDIYTLVLPENVNEPLQEPMRLTYLESNSDLPAYSPDGMEIAFYSMHDDIMKIWHVGVEGGTPRPYPSTRGSMVDAGLTWGPGERIIYRSGKFTNFKILDPATGEEADLIRMDSKGYTFGPFWSQSGDRVALFMNKLSGEGQDMGLWVLSVTDGKLIQLIDSILWPIAWSEGDRWIYASGASGQDWNEYANTTIFRINPQDGHLESHAVLPFQIRDSSQLTITPDGRTIVFLKGDTTSDIWLVEDFDPEIE
jgi:serine/threonine protein kinase